MPVHSKLSPGLYHALKSTALAIHKAIKQDRKDEDPIISRGLKQVEIASNDSTSRLEDNIADVSMRSRRLLAAERAENLQDQESDFEPPPVPTIFGLGLDPTAQIMGSNPNPVESKSKTEEGRGFGTVLSPGIFPGCQLIFPEPWAKFWNWHYSEQEAQLNSSDYDVEAYDFGESCRRGEEMFLRHFGSMFILGNALGLSSSIYR